MRWLFASTLVLGISSIEGAIAQTPQAAPPHVPSAITLESPGLAKPDNASAPQPGANSFAESQARTLIESKGYQNVSPLVNDAQGIWHGTATKGDAKVNVSVDYKGHVDAK